MTAAIVIADAMEAAAVAALAAAHETLHDPSLAAAPQLAVIGRLGAGLQGIDLGACRARGVEVIPATGANADSVAEYVMLAIGQLLRGGAFAATEAVAAGGWPRAELGAGREIRGKTLGIIGFGDIGRRVAKLARAFGMQIVAHDPVLPEGHAGWTETPTERLALAALLARADAVTLHVPPIAATRGLLGADAIAAMKPGAVLVNTAGGGVVEESALAAALRAGRLAGAALDVFEAEPLPPGSPLLGCPNLILSPHVAGMTAESSTRVSTLIAERVLVALAMG